MYLLEDSNHLDEAGDVLTAMARQDVKSCYSLCMDLIDDVCLPANVLYIAELMKSELMAAVKSEKQMNIELTYIGSKVSLTTKRNN